MYRAGLQQNSLLHRLRQGRETLQRVWVFGNSCRLKCSYIAEQKLKVSLSRCIRPVDTDPCIQNLPLVP